MSLKDAEFFDGGWCWMTHPSRNDGNAVPVKMEMIDGARFYRPLDPEGATEFEWDERDDEWQIIVPALAAALIDAAPDLLAACRKAFGVLAGEDMNKSALIDALTMCRSAIEKATKP